MKTQVDLVKLAKLPFLHSRKFIGSFRTNKGRVSWIVDRSKTPLRIYILSTDDSTSGARVALEIVKVDLLRRDPSLLYQPMEIFFENQLGTSHRSVRFGQNRDDPSLTKLVRFSDWLPSPAMRKQVKKMLADQEVFIADLVKKRRLNAARWQVGCTWLLTGSVICCHALTAAVKVMRGKWRSS